MADEGYTSSTTWPGGDSSDHTDGLHNSNSYGRPSFQSLDSVDESSSSGLHVLSTSPQPRSSTDSAGRSPLTQPWRDPGTALPADRRDTLSTIHSNPPSLVEPSFDENVLRALCELDVSFRWLHPPFDINLFQCGVPLLLDRIKQSMVSCRV